MQHIQKQLFSDSESYKLQALQTAHTMQPQWVHSSSFSARSCWWDGLNDLQRLTRPWPGNMGQQVTLITPCILIPHLGCSQHSLQRKAALFVYTTFTEPQHSRPWDYYSVSVFNRKSFTGHISLLTSGQSFSMFLKIHASHKVGAEHNYTLLPYAISSKHMEISLHLSEIPAEQVKWQRYIFNFSFPFHPLMQVYT